MLFENINTLNYNNSMNAPVLLKQADRHFAAMHVSPERPLATVCTVSI
jgi:hypothetical protein